MRERKATAMGPGSGSSGTMAKFARVLNRSHASRFAPGREPGPAHVASLAHRFVVRVLLAEVKWSSSAMQRNEVLAANHTLGPARYWCRLGGPHRRSCLPMPSVEVKVGVRATDSIKSVAALQRASFIGVLNHRIAAQPTTLPSFWGPRLSLGHFPLTQAMRHGWSSQLTLLHRLSVQDLFPSIFAICRSYCSRLLTLALASPIPSLGFT